MKVFPSFAFWHCSQEKTPGSLPSFTVLMFAFRSEKPGNMAFGVGVVWVLLKVILAGTTSQEPEHKSTAITAV